MTFLAHCDQTRFIRGRLATDNLRRLLHIIDASRSDKTPVAVLSSDAVKVFDRLEWSVLGAMGLGGGFIHMVKVLYSEPSAMVLTGRTCLPPFAVLRSSRQGCPLSPGLFALSLEPLAQFIRHSQNISPIPILGTLHRIALFADDMLIFMQNPSTSINHLLKIVEDFGNLSGFKINWPKSALLPINEAATPPADIPLVEHFKYLGVEIFPMLNQTVRQNYSNMFNNVIQDLNRWSGLPNLLQTQAAIIKMNILQRINFLSSMFPLPPPDGYWKKLQSAILKFIWNSKWPRLKISTAQRKKQNGGVGNLKF